MAALRRMSIGVRLRVLVGVLVLFISALAATGYTRISSGTSASEQLRDSNAMQAIALRVQYDFADLNGWQNAYAFDAARHGPAGVVDTAGNRKTFLEVAERTRADLRAMAGDLVGDPQPWLTLQKTAQDRFDRFMTVDGQIARLYRQGGPAAAAQADALVNGAEVQTYTAGFAAVQQLVGKLTEHAASTTAQARADGSTGHRMIGLITIIALLIGAGSALLVTGSIGGPLRALRDRLGEIAHGNGDLTVRLDTSGRDELTSISELFNTFVEQIAGTVRDVSTSATTLAAAAEELSGNTGVIAAASQETSAQAAAVAEASRQVDAGVQGFSGAAGELRQSIGEIAQSATEAAEVAADAVHLADTTMSTVQALGASSAEISGVVVLINGVAEQTNLLALNATIEAARAGDAGKGFAVVATEVKELAQETARATQDITDRIEQIQAQTTQAVAAISEITQVISKINDYQMSIAGAVEQQTATTVTMTATVAEAAAGTRGITTNIDGVAESAEATSRSVVESQHATDELARMSAHLQSAVARFRA